MPIVEQIDRELVAAMKAKDAEKVSALRMVKAAFGNYIIEKKKEKLEDADAVAILQKQVKQRHESFESFEKAGRKDLAEKEKKEIDILQAYLPKQMPEEELKALAQKAIADAGATTKADAGKVMKDLMPRVQGKADGKRVNAIVMELLA